ncbi:hypothetical protein Btru_037479, partial [Bulinus truncatus]
IIKSTSDTSSKSNLLNDAATIDFQEPKSVTSSRLKCRVSKRQRCAKSNDFSIETVSSEEIFIRSEDLQNKEEQKASELLQYLENGHCGEKKGKPQKSNVEKRAAQNMLKVDNNNKNAYTDITEKSVLLNKEECEHKQNMVEDHKQDKSRMLTYKNAILEENIHKETLSASSTLSKINCNTQNPIRRSTRIVSKKQISEMPMVTESAELISKEDTTVSQCSSSSSVSSVSSTQQFTKPKPVVSRTYAKGMQNIFHAEGCVRNWVETLPKVTSDNCDDVKEIKRLTTKEKINVKKRSSFHLVTEETHTSDASFKMSEDKDTEIKSGSGTYVQECQFTPRPKRNIFKRHSEGTIVKIGVAVKDPFEFTSSQTPTKSVNIKTMRKKSKGENKSTKSDKMTPLNFICATDGKTPQNEKTAGQHNEVENNKVNNKETFASLSMKLKNNEPAECDDNAVDGKNVQNEIDVTNNCTNSGLDSITSNHQEELIDTVACKNRDISSSKCRARKRKALWNKNETVINEELCILSQRSGREMMKLIDKISQAESHELLFSTQDIQKKMDESLQNDQNEVCHISTSQTYSLTLSSNVSVIQNTATVEDNMSVKLNVYENSEPGTVAETETIPSESKKFSDYKMVAGTEKIFIELDRVFESEKSESLKQQDDTLSFTNDNQKKNLEEISGYPFNIINVPDNLKTLQKKCISDTPKIPQSRYSLENSRTTEAEHLSESSEAHQVKNFAGNLLTAPVENIAKLSNISQAKSAESPKAPLANKSFNSLIIQKTHPLSTRGDFLNRSFSSKFPLPSLKEMIQVSPGPKGFIPVTNNSSVTNSSDKCDDLNADKKISEESHFLLIENSETANDTNKNILVADTVAEAGSPDTVCYTQNQVIQETLDVYDISITRPRMTDNTNINQPMVELHPDTGGKFDSLDIKIVDTKISQQTIMETQCSSSHLSFNVEKEDTLKRNLNRENDVQGLSGSNRVSMVDNLQSENPEETPSSLSQSILRVDHKHVTLYDQETFSNEKEDDGSVKKTSIKRGKIKQYTKTDSDTQAHDASPNKGLPLTVSDQSCVHTEILSTDSFNESLAKRAQVSRKHKKPCESISSAPSKYNCVDSDDEDSVLIVRRSKRRCFSLNNTPLKPVVFGTTPKSIVDDLISETEVVESLVNCTESDKNIDQPSETTVRTELFAANSEAYCHRLSLSDCLIAPESQQTSGLLQQQNCLIAINENLQTEVCSESSTVSHNIPGSLQTVGTSKTRRGLASKKIIFGVDNLSKHVPQETSKYDKPDIRPENNNADILVVEDSETEQEENSEPLLFRKLECDAEKSNNSPTLSVVSVEHISSDSKGSIHSSLNSDNCEDMLKKQLEEELFGDEIIKSKVTTIKTGSNQVVPNKKHMVSKAESLGDEEEVSFDLGLFTVDPDNSSTEMKKCTHANDNKEIISEQNLDVQSKNVSLKLPNSIQHLDISMPVNCEETNLENENIHTESPPLTSSPVQDIHEKWNSTNHENLNQSAIVTDKEDDVDDEENDDDDDCARVKKKTKKQMISSDSDTSDCEDLTRSSFMSSQSETLTTQQQLALEGDLEKLHQEIAKYEAELKKQSSKCLSQDRNSKEFHSNSVKGDSRKSNPLVIDDSPVENDEDSNDLFQSPEYSPKPCKEKQGLTGVKNSKPGASQVTDHFLKQFQSPGGSIRSKKCLEFIPSRVVQESGCSNRIKSSKRLSKTDMHLQKSDSRKKHVDKSVDEDVDENLSISPILVTQKKNQSAETKKTEGNDKKIETHKNFFLIASGLSKDDHILLLKFCDKFGAVLYPKFTTEVSHVIMKPAVGYELVCDRTLKFFQGVAHRCWVLSFSWIMKSLEIGNLLTEVDYEIEGDTSFGEKVNGAKHARLSKIPLFHNFSFACIGNSEEMSKENLSDILQVSGAIIVDDPIALTAQPTKYRLIIRCSDGDNIPSSVELDIFNGLYKNMKLITVMREWVLDSLSSYKLIPLADYVLITADHSQLPF